MELPDPRKTTATILLNEHSVKLSSKHISRTHAVVQLSDLITEVSLCGGQ